MTATLKRSCRISTNIGQRVKSPETLHVLERGYTGYSYTCRIVATGMEEFRKVGSGCSVMHSGYIICKILRRFTLFVVSL